MNIAVIFDMDGLLIDSEPLWWQAGVETLATVGVSIDASRATETTGLRTDAAVAHWYRHFPWTGKSREQVERELNARVIELIAQQAEALPGVHELVALLTRRDIPMGLCTSSPKALIEVVLKSLGLESAIAVAYSAEDEPLGKPHPGPYLACASRLGVPAQQCIALEDSLNGAISAKAARMKVVAVPRGADAKSSRFDFCDVRLRSLEQFDALLLDRLSLR